ncbi:MAG: hypothetical protein J2P36_32965, partial [Ktedonobacteraceae bacterium]|nr:hypothetical protein [Ktedonobacteraceae bacterium]
MHRRRFIQHSGQCVLLLAVSACSPLNGNAGSATPTARQMPATPTASPTPGPKSDSELAASIVQHMSLDQ